MARGHVESANMLSTLTQNWLTGKNQKPSTQLSEAWKSVITASLLSTTALPDAPRESITKFCLNIIERIADRVEESIAEEYDLAVEQVVQHLGADPDIFKREFATGRLAGGWVHQPAPQ